MMAENTLNPEIDNYLAEGCGRCPLVSTPKCKVNTWREELALLRPIVLDCGLTEELKWSVPCYTYNGNNILLMSALKDYCALSFFKGALMNDPDEILFQQTKNMQATRLIRFTSVQEIIELEPVIRTYIQNAIEVEEAGLEVDYKSTEEFDFPDELRQMMDEMPEFEDAFNALTPGRQRGYLLYFSGAKQSKTRTARIEKHMQRIFDGKGLHDRD
jgi:uncharacterized protein YdeI (YjbR/CyaY-like superfamily)